VRVLIFHGYLLRGTGSNVYNANLAAALVGLGHEVHLLCQERHAADLEFVGAVGDWDAGTLRVRRLRSASCAVYRPSIGQVLPVYVRDRYEGVQARPFPELSDDELGAYLKANVAAVAEVAARAAPDAALANHLIMGPAILARALAGTGVPYAVTIHGSALEYTVKPNPRFLPYACEGLAQAKGILVGSRHTAESLWAALGDPSLPARTRLGPPGVDAQRFRPLSPEEARARLAAAAESLRGRALAQRIAPPASLETAAAEPSSDFERDYGATARALEALARQPPKVPLVGFVGKLIPAKGIDLLLLAWPLVLAEIPSAVLTLAGFGAWRGEAEDLLEALARGDLETVRRLMLAAQRVHGLALAFLDWLKRSAQRQRYMEAARAAPARVLFTGRLEHEELTPLLALCEAIVVPSTFPEAFGMVAAEAAACGALPISAAHSGLAEVSRVLAANLPGSLRELVSFPLAGDAVPEIAARLIRWLRAPAQVRVAARSALARAVADRYSWERVADGVLAAACGELAALEPPA
jgi:glycosyltransferase involved in cell wall biosynthesis